MSTNGSEELRAEWLKRLSELVDTVEAWAADLGWATRRIEINREDSRLGKYKAPALLMQFEVVRVILEPIARFAPGTEGIVDLYLMPAYDDIASLYHRNGSWRLHYASPLRESLGIHDDEAGRQVSKEVVREVLEAMKEHALQ